MTSADAFHIYKTQNSDEKIGFSSFKSLKPKQVRRVSETNKKSCLCQICCNIALKAESLTSFMKTNKDKISTVINTDKKTLSDITLCPVSPVSPVDNKHNPKCLRRECSKCGTSMLKDHLKSVEESVEEESQNTEIQWYKWEHILVE